MEIRTLDSASDIPAWVTLRIGLWPEQDADELAREAQEALAGDPPLRVFVAEEAGRLIGFLEISLRAYAEGAENSPVPYVEGWFVTSDWRGKGVGKALMAAAENWSRSQGFKEMGSDALAENTLSRKVHAALGFSEVETLVVFRKVL